MGNKIVRAMAWTWFVAFLGAAAYSYVDDRVKQRELDQAISAQQSVRSTAEAFERSLNMCDSNNRQLQIELLRRRISKETQ